MTRPKPTTLLAAAAATAVLAAPFVYRSMQPATNPIANQLATFTRLPGYYRDNSIAEKASPRLVRCEPQEAPGIQWGCVEVYEESGVPGVLHMMPLEFIADTERGGYAVVRRRPVRVNGGDIQIEVIR